MVVPAEDQRERVAEKRKRAKIRDGIGLCLLKAYEHDLKEPMPPQIVELLRKLEQRLAERSLPPAMDIKR